MMVSLQNTSPVLSSMNKCVLPWIERPCVLNLLPLLSLELTWFLILPQILEFMNDC